MSAGGCDELEMSAPGSAGLRKGQPEGAVLVAGFGFREAATVESLATALAAACAGLEGGALAALAAPQDKTGAACLRALALQLGLPVVGIAAAALEAAPTLTRAPRVVAARGTGSVAEASALCAAGAGARLLGPRAVSADRLATAALAAAGPAPAALDGSAAAAPPAGFAGPVDPAGSAAPAGPAPIGPVPTVVPERKHP